MAEGTLISKDQLEALAAKLDTLDLDDDERLVLQAVFAAATPSDEVSGYALNAYRQGSLSEGFMNVFKPGGKIGFGFDGDPGGGGIHITNP